MGTKNFSYDAAAILGLSPPCSPRIPKGAPGVYMMYYGGWSMKTLRDSERGLQLVNQDQVRWGKWIGEQPPAGIYAVRIPVQGTAGKAHEDQLALIPAGEEPAPAVIIASLLLCVALTDYSDPLNGQSTRCKEDGSSAHYPLILCWSNAEICPFEAHDRHKANDLLITSCRLLS